jgi:assimilatory nitrate reductase catalytic subunit
MVAITPRAPAHALDTDYPLILNTGRVRDQWHTMTRTGKSQRLSGHEVESFVEVHADDAARYPIKDGELARIESRWGATLARVHVTADQRPGSVFMPMHWNDQFTNGGGVDLVVNPACDPISGQPESKHTPVRVSRHGAAWYGFLLSRRNLRIELASYWSRAKGAAFYRYELAGDAMPDDWAQWARALLCHHDGKAEWIEFFDKKPGRYRAARIVHGNLESCLFVARDPALPSRAWLASLFEFETLSDADRTSLLTGKPARGAVDRGEIVCACFSVGTNTINEAIAGGCSSVEQIGARLKAGTNCGSCIPELKRLLLR